MYRKINLHKFLNVTLYLFTLINRDIPSYIKTGIGRHGDSMGNREKFETPGMQWISFGSGIEHAEGGATPKGDDMTGFQIWLNVPSTNKIGMIQVMVRNYLHHFHKKKLHRDLT